LPFKLSKSGAENSKRILFHRFVGDHSDRAVCSCQTVYGVDVHGVCAQDITRDDSKGNNCGFFRIRRGTNEAGIEAEVVAGVVAKSSDASCSASCKAGIYYPVVAPQADTSDQCHITSFAPSNPCKGDGAAGIRVQLVDAQDTKRHFSGQFDMSGPATAEGVRLPPGLYQVRHAAVDADGALLSPYVLDGGVTIKCAEGKAPEYDACAVRQGDKSTRCVKGACEENTNGEAECTCYSPYSGDRSDKFGSSSFIPHSFVLHASVLQTTHGCTHVVNPLQLRSAH
jgi:hypothetical protein